MPFWGLMKILQIHNFYNTPGGECSVVRAERRLLEANGHSVQQFVVDSGKIAGQSLGRKALSFVQIPYNFQVLRSLARFLRDNRPVVAHVHNVFPLLSPSVYVALKRARIPVVQTIHNYRFLCPNGTFFTQGHVCQACLHEGLTAAIKNKCMRDSRPVSTMYAAAIGLAWRSGNLPNNIDRYIALNQFGMEQLVAGGIPREKIRICGNFVERFAEVPSAKASYILYLGRLSSEKGLWTLIKAMHKVPAGLVLKIAGKGPLDRELKEYVKIHALNVEFLGFVAGSEKERLIAGAICTATPSECYENFPISVLESLALGTPVIASRIGGLPEMIEKGVSGELFTPGCADELAEVISRFVEKRGETNSMALGALDAARSRFGPENHIQGLISIYQEAIVQYGYL